jgi:hypothetical protein
VPIDQEYAGVAAPHSYAPRQAVPQTGHHMVDHHWSSKQSSRSGPLDIRTPHGACLPVNALYHARGDNTTANIRGKRSSLMRAKTQASILSGVEGRGQACTRVPSQPHTSTVLSMLTSYASPVSAYYPGALSRTLSPGIRGSMVRDMYPGPRSGDIHPRPTCERQPASSGTHVPRIASGIHIPDDQER